MVRGFLLISVLLSGGCTLLQSPMESTASLLGRERPPEMVSGLDYASMDKLGALRDECARLAEFHQRRDLVRRDLLEQRLLPECRQIIHTEQQRIHAEYEKAALAARQRRELQRVQQRRKEQARRREQAAEQAQREEERAALLERETRELRQERLDNARVHEALAQIPARPVAQFAGQPGNATLHYFLACLEITYPNGGYRAEHTGRELTLEIQDVQMPRGDVPVEMNFREQGEYWLMTHLKVADIEARTAEDRFVLSQNLVVEGCPGEEDLFGR